MNNRNNPFQFEFEYNGEIIPVSAKLVPATKESWGTFVYHSQHPTFFRFYQTNTILKAYETLSTAGGLRAFETDKVLFTYKLCLASYRKFRKLTLNV